MVGYIVRRLGATVPVLFGVSVLVFAIIHAVPGHLVQLIAVRSFAALTPAQEERIRHELGLDRPLVVQYGDFVDKALRGDLGRSFYTNRLVTTSIIEQLPATLELAGAGMLFAVAVGGGLGLVAAIRHNSWLDNLAMLFSLGGLSIPMFWSGLLLIYLFAVRLHWVHIVGGAGWKALVLPAIALGYDAAAFISRMVRSSVLEVLRQEYVRIAYAKGLSERTVIFRHVLKAAMIPIVTLVGLNAGRLLSGAVVVETVFARQGIGRLAVEAILYKDYFLVQGVVLLAALIYVSLNLMIDISYAWLDPRIHYQ
ncbi:MAG TPA: ABC transporter permease [bacterium]|nr:ABC transporter permease [bacterium]